MEEEDVLKEIKDIDTLQSDLYKIKSLNETIKDVYIKNKEELESNLKHVTEIFKSKLKQNKEFSLVVNNYVNTFVKDEGLKEFAKEELFLILSAEMLGMFRGIAHSNCSMSPCVQM
jgi:hypothetical protein